MQHLSSMTLCLMLIVAACGMRQAEQDQIAAEKTLLKEQEQIEKVEKQIKDLKEATAY